MAKSVRERIWERIVSFFEDQTAGRIHEPELGQHDHRDCRFYTSQPSPNQWVAVGITATLKSSADPNHRLLVGTGRSEVAAIRSLHRRCQWNVTSSTPVSRPAK